MTKINEWLGRHEWLRRALRTFLQTAAGVLAAAVTEASGALGTLDMEAVVVLAVATGLAAVMNLQAKEESDHDGSDPGGV